MVGALIRLKKLLAGKTATTPKEWEVRCNNLASYSSILLGLVPNHDKISCSDKSPKNVGVCTRCTLLWSQRSGRWSPDMDLEIKVGPRKR